MASETIFKRQFPEYGYEVRTEMVDNPEKGAESIKMRNAYTMSGAYIGDHTTAEYLCEIQGIAPKLATPESKVCSIGFCEKERKWYGWSRLSRIKGFGIGSSVKRVVPADIATGPPEDEDTSIRTSSHKRTREHKRSSYPSEPVQEEEWTAKTLDDARRMAIDFAERVS